MRFHRFDAFAKTVDDFSIKTVSGAVLTLISFMLIFVLVVSEYISYSTVRISPQLVVDKNRKEKMTINLNISFPNLPCFVTGLDVVDISGEKQINIEHDVHKQRLSHAGIAIDVTPVSAKHNPYHSTDLTQKVECGNCFGGIAADKSGCCNSCDEVRDAYHRKGWSFSDPDKITQCVQEGYTQHLKEQADEGCNFHGSLHVHKVQGTFHFSPGRSLSAMNNIAVLRQVKSVDFTHIIHHLSFGDSVDFVNPLDGSSEIIENHEKEIFQYFIKVVGSDYIYLNGTETSTNQYSHTVNVKKINDNGHIPGLFFNYDISGMKIIYKQYRKSFGNFLTNVFGIIGGIYTLVGLFDSFLHYKRKHAKK